MEEMLNESKSRRVHNVVRDMKYAKKSMVIDRITKCARDCKKKGGQQVYIYYTGHGETNTGNWCFSDGSVSLSDVLKAVIAGYPNVPSIALYCGCCYSGNWCVKLASKYKKVKANVFNLSIYAASWPGHVAWDSKDGGMFTLHRAGKKKEKNLPKLKWCGVWCADQQMTPIEFYWKGKMINADTME